MSSFDQLPNSSAGAHLIKFAQCGENQIAEFTPEEFETLTGRTYLPSLEFQSEAILERIKMQCARAIRIGVIGSDSRWLGALHASEIRNQVVADVSIRWIDENIGYGLFAESSLEPGDFIGEYTGVVRSCNPFFGNVNAYCFGYPTSALTFRKHVIDAYQKGNELRFANHSEDPNSESMGIYVDGIMHVIVRAIKPISVLEEIRYKYSGFHWLSKRRRNRKSQR